MRNLIASTFFYLSIYFMTVALWLANPDTPAQPQKQIILSRRHYRVVNRTPGRWEVIMAGFSILFRSVAFAAVGA